jgi:hypothetical protein
MISSEALSPTVGRPFESLGLVIPFEGNMTDTARGFDLTTIDSSADNPRRWLMGPPVALCRLTFRRELLGARSRLMFSSVLRPLGIVGDVGSLDPLVNAAKALFRLICSFNEVNSPLRAAMVPASSTPFVAAVSMVK